ncbi:acetate--CoA ligase family protein [Desulfallas sp. Bu1-1]|uniref:acetate--CoA ligase family protein n=1 Tax=Desulfallas sp. Bu1-1 TaxID=2787620 RepID=UPI00189DE1BA|nr:acetate--CoA ligase family protein [Desulfallas sp. Bu1-1]MBF7082854.1 acetate--CoA ligase family protein [Desulfallas sp. Bu1-1]
MHKLFYPESVVVYGVSNSPTNLGRTIIQNLEHFKFKGHIHAVGSESGDLNGRKIFPGLEEIEGIPDLAVILIPARSVPEALEACGEKGIRYAIIESGGFNEFGGQGLALQQQVMDIARKWGIRFVGPNCIGIINMENSLALPFSLLDASIFKKGSISIVSQSGGFVVDALHLLLSEKIGVNKVISMGNKLDFNENDYLEFLLSDPGTKIIVLYLENISDGRRLMSLAGKTGKPIIVLKANIGAESHQAAQFHTAALAGDDAVADAALKQACMHRVQNMQEMLDFAKIFSLPLLKGPNLAIISRSGGYAVMLADAVHRYGFRLAKMSDVFFDMVGAEARAGVIRMTNPLDLGDVFNVDFYLRLVERALQEETVDGLVFNHAIIFDTDVEPTHRLISSSMELAVKYGKPVVFRMLPIDEWLMHGPIFSEADYALKALSKSLTHYNKLQERDRSNKPGLITPPISSDQIVIRNSADVLDVLRAYGLSVADYELVNDLSECLRAAEKIGYPVALKTASKDIIHKTEAGGVRLNIENPEELERAFLAMHSATRKHRNKEDGGFLVQKMAPAGLEVFIGGKQDPEFGPVILFGLGGIFLEVLKDISMRIAPIDERVASEMIEEIKGHLLLKGFRGRQEADVSFLIKCLIRISQLLTDHSEIKNLDLNPLIVLEKGRGGMIVDAKMEIALS